MRICHWPFIGQAALILGALSPHSTSASTSPAVNVALQARFDAPPYLVELLETAADENATAYLPLIGRIADGYFDGRHTEKEQYEAFLQLLQDDKHIPGPDALSSFRFALSIHASAPRIEAHYQFYRTSVEPALEAEQGERCETWVLLDNKQYCSPDELTREHGLVKNARSDHLPFDRISSHGGGIVSPVLYADITSPSFRNFHHAMVKIARNGEPGYRLRHKPPVKNRLGPLNVQGFGVELALKRTDYIVIDDRRPEDGVHAPPPVSAAQTALGDDEVADLESDVRALGLKAGSFVMSSDDRLDTLLKLSRDWPKHSSAIAAHNISGDFLKEHQKNRAAILPAGYNALWINGAQVAPRDVDAFSILDRMRRERHIIESMRGFGFSAPEAIALLSSSNIARAKDDDEPQRYDWRDTTEGGHVIVFLNNLEKDGRYADWPETLRMLLQPSYPGALPSVKRDIQNVIIPLDVTSTVDATVLVKTLQGMVKRKLPIRWGIVPSTKNAKAERQAYVVYYLQE